VVNSVVGWTSARVLRRGTAELDAVERSRHAWALHDRVLQTLKTLANRVTLADPALLARVVEDAAWLRMFVETGELEQRDDLTGKWPGGGVGRP
jgi:hypothetical protein